MSIDALNKTKTVLCFINQEVSKDNNIFKKTEIKSFVDLGSNVVTIVKSPDATVHVSVDELTENKIQPVYITTAKPLINNFINVGLEDSVNSEEIGLNEIVQAQKVVTLKPFVYIVTTAGTTPTARPTTSDILLSTESFFLEHNKVQEISLAEGDPITPSKVNSFTHFNNDGNFHNFMHNFGSTIDQVLFPDKNHSELQSDKYFSLFKDFQDFKSKHTASPSPLSYLSSSTSKPTTTTTLPPSTTTPETYQVHTTSKINVLKNLFKKIIPKKTLPLVKTPPLLEEEEQYTENDSAGLFDILLKGKEIVKERLSNIGKRYWGRK